MEKKRGGDEFFCKREKKGGKVLIALKKNVQMCREGTFSEKKVALG